MYNDSVAAVLNILEQTSRSCGNILYFYQHCQSDKLTLEVMLLMIEYLIYG